MKKTLKILSLILVFTMVLGLSLTGCGEKKEAKASIALITSSAGANDNGYNQSAIKGLNKAKEEFGVETKVVESTDIPGSLKQLAEAGYKLIFSLEYSFDDLIKGSAGAPPIAEQYPDTTFVVFNDNPNVDEAGNTKHKNVISVLFDIHESSFAAGALATLVNENAEALLDPAQYNFTKGDAGRKVGFIGGTNSNGITVFSYGFAEGVNYVAKEKNVKYTMFTDYNAGFQDSATGGTKAGAFYSEGANIITACAGAVGDGVTAKAKAEKKLAIEVDNNKDANQPGYILTSILKNTEVPVYEIIKSMNEGKLESLERVLSYNLASGATGITDLSTFEKMIKPDGKTKWEEIKKEVKDIESKIASGEIKVTNAQAGQKLDTAKLTNLTLPNG